MKGSTSTGCFLFPMLKPAPSLCSLIVAILRCLSSPGVLYLVSPYELYSPRTIGTSTHAANLAPDCIRLMLQAVVASATKVTDKEGVHQYLQKSHGALLQDLIAIYPGNATKRSCQWQVKRNALPALRYLIGVGRNCQKQLFCCTKSGSLFYLTVAMSAPDKD